MKKITYLLLFFLLTQVAAADVESEAEKLLKKSVNEVFSVLSDKEITMDQKKSKVVEITNSVFSFPLMAKLSVGKAYWSDFTAEQRAEFTILFTERFQSFYVDKLGLFSDEEVVFLLATITKKKKAQIPTVLISRGKEYSILYRMFKTRNGWKIYDTEIEGVSMLRSYQSQYHHILKKNSIEDLLEKMRKPKKTSKVE